MSWIIRGLSVLLLVAQSARVGLPPADIHVLETALFLLFFNSGLILPLVLARRQKPSLNMAFLVALVPAGAAALSVFSGVEQATNSTAGLGLLVIPMLQWVILGLAAAIGMTAESDARRKA